MTKRIVLLVAFIATVVGANWALDRYGLVSIGFGLTAPAGVYFAGLAFGLRDALHEAGGRRWVVGAIVGGAALSWFISDGALIPGGHVSIAAASGLAFLFSEACDLVVYERTRNIEPDGGRFRDGTLVWPIAVIASNIVGAVVDSMLFLWLAFGSIDHLSGQVIGKLYMTVLALPIVWWARHRSRRAESAWA